MAEIIQTPLTVMHVLSCVFLILVILLQPGKSGGGGIFGSAGAQQVFGGRGAGNFLTKTTWATGMLFFVTSMTLAYLSSSSDEALQKKAQTMNGGMSKGIGKPIKLRKR
jgi:preprotein translocase subunit SecG